MPRKVLLLDTSILCVWLQIPGKETCGPRHDLWNQTRVAYKIQEEIDSNTAFVLPLAAIIETGNHICQMHGNPYPYARKLGELIRKVADEDSPWAAFQDQTQLWTPEMLHKLAENWPEKAKEGLSLADLTISGIAEHYARSGLHVELFTGDQGLKAYEPAAPPLIPRRKKHPA